MAAISSGTSGNDTLTARSALDTLAGGLGNDTYYLNWSSVKVVENANAGTDTVVSYALSYQLAENLENLIVGTAGAYGGGNGLDNVLRANAAGQTLDGGGGNDTLVGSAGTTFAIVAGNGSDRIQGWVASDTIRLAGYGMTTFDDVRRVLHQVGANAELDFANGERLVLAGVQASTLGAANFQLEVDRSRMTLAFSDGFDKLSLWNPVSNPGGTWRDDFGYGGYGTISSRTLVSNHEAEVYMDAGFKGTGPVALGIDPFAVSNGVLTITAAPTPTADLKYLNNLPYTSGLLTTKQSFSMEYGYFEARVKMPAGQGFWPAFWLLPADGTWPPEIDVFEQLGKDPGTIYLTEHAAAAGAASTSAVHVDTTQWHTYGVDWEKDFLTYYIDGVAVARQATPAGMDKEMYMLLDLAVGGAGSWPGATNATTGTGQLQLDFVHAYATAGTVSTTINGVHSTAIMRPPPMAPRAIDDTYAVSANGSLTVAAALGLLANDSHDAALAVSALLQAGPAHGTLALGSDGGFVYTPVAGFAGTDSFTYLERDAAGAGSLATATITVAAEVKPASLYIAGGAGNDVIDKSASGFGWLINGGGGDDRIYGGAGANGLNGGAGNDTMVGGSGADTITGGGGADVMTGGGGNDVFAVVAGDLVSAAAGAVDRITDFHVAAAGGEHDLLRLTGFGAGATLTAGAAHADGSYTYHVSAGVNSGDVTIQAGGRKLAAEDYYFA